MKILIAEDIAYLAAALQAQFERKGHTVLVAKNGVQAVQTFKENPDVDFVLTDWNLPGLNGIEVAQQIRQINLSARIWLQTGNIAGIQYLLSIRESVGLEKVLLKDNTLDELRRSSIIS